VKRVLLVSTLAALLGGCVVGGENARHDMETSKAAYKACLAVQGPEACEGQRQAYEADISAYRATPKFVIGAGSPPPVATPDSLGTALGGPMVGGQTVYSQRECIGAVVMGQCHGSILPDYSRPHPTCYGRCSTAFVPGQCFDRRQPVTAPTRSRSEDFW
jgi:hypothetical protein